MGKAFNIACLIAVCANSGFHCMIGVSVTYELSISRNGALVELASKARDAYPDQEIADIFLMFRKQATLLKQTRPLAKAYNHILDVAKKCFDSSLSGEVDEFSQDNPINFFALDDHDSQRDRFVSSGDSEEISPLIALFPPRRIQLRSKNRDWILRVRASVTSGAPQDLNKQTKLWWTFEGVPDLKAAETFPTAQDVAQFFEMTREMEKKAMPFLHEAFQQSIFDLTGVSSANRPLQELINIEISDNQAFSTAALIDALYFEGLSLSEITANEQLVSAHDGWKEFSKFLSKVSDHNILMSGKKMDEDINIFDAVEGAKGILLRHQRKNSSTVHFTGIAHQSGRINNSHSLSPALRKFDTDEKYLRTMSAARQISAVIADGFARRIYRNGIEPK